MLCENNVKLLIVKVLNFLFELKSSFREFEMHDSYAIGKHTGKMSVCQNARFMFVLTKRHEVLTLIQI